MKTNLEEQILYIRGIKVMIDRDLAVLYGTSTRGLNQAVKRNLRRFPEDFMFRLSAREFEQLVTDCDRFRKLKHSSSLPHVFTEHGAVMLASVLNSEKAIQARFIKPSSEET